MPLRGPEVAKNSTNSTASDKTVDCQCKVQNITRGWTEEVLFNFKRFVSSKKIQLKNYFVLERDSNEFSNSICSRIGGALAKKHKKIPSIVKLMKKHFLPPLQIFNKLEWFLPDRIRSFQKYYKFKDNVREFYWTLRSLDLKFILFRSYISHASKLLYIAPETFRHISHSFKTLWVFFLPASIRNFFIKKLFQSDHQLRLEGNSWYESFVSWNSVTVVSSLT